MSWLAEMLLQMIAEVLAGLVGHGLGERFRRLRPRSPDIVSRVSEGSW